MMLADCATMLFQSSNGVFGSNDTEVVAVVFGTLAFAALALTMVTQRYKLRMQRLEVLRTALDRGALDPGLRDELLRVLSNEHRFGPLALLRPLLQARLWQRLSFGAGWMLFMLSGGMAVLSALDVFNERIETIVPYTVLGLAMMTLPLGLRELSRREQAVLDRK